MQIYAYTYNIFVYIQNENIYKNPTFEFRSLNFRKLLIKWHKLNNSPRSKANIE